MKEVITLSSIFVILLYDFIKRKEIAAIIIFSSVTVTSFVYFLLLGMIARNDILIPYSYFILSLLVIIIAFFIVRYAIQVKDKIYILQRNKENIIAWSVWTVFNIIVYFV